MRAWFMENKKVGWSSVARIVGDIAYSFGRI